MCFKLQKNGILFLALALNCWECSSLQHQYCDSFNPDRMVDEYNLDRYVKCSNKCIKLKTRGKNISEFSSIYSNIHAHRWPKFWINHKKCSVDYAEKWKAFNSISYIPKFIFSYKPIPSHGNTCEVGSSANIDVYHHHC